MDSVPRCRWQSFEGVACGVMVWRTQRPSSQTLADAEEMRCPLHHQRALCGRGQVRPCAAPSAATARRAQVSVSGASPQDPQLLDALQQLQSILTYHSVDSSDPGVPPLQRAWQAPARPHGDAPATHATPGVLVAAAARQGGLLPTHERLQAALHDVLSPGQGDAADMRSRLQAGELVPLEALAGLQLAEQERGRKATAGAVSVGALVVAELHSQLPPEPAPPDPKLRSDLPGSPDPPSLPPLDAEELEALRQVLTAATGAAPAVSLVQHVAWMVQLGCLPPPGANGAYSEHRNDQRGAQAACGYLEAWLGHARARHELSGEAGLLFKLDTCFHLLLRTPAQVDAALQALGQLLQAPPGPLVGRAPHLLSKSPAQLESDLEALMDVTQAPPWRLVTAITADAGILAHHHTERLARRWSHLLACTTPSGAWRRQLAELAGPDLAAALTASHSALDGLQYMRERGQDQAHTLAEALGMVRQGLGRRFRRWRQRHVLRGQWHTLHERGAPPEAEVEGVELARAAVLQWRAEARRAEAARREAHVAAWRQERLLRGSLDFVRREYGLLPDPGVDGG